MTKQDLLKMKLGETEVIEHESIDDPHYRIVRVLGGWIYEFIIWDDSDFRTGAVVFVPEKPYI